MLSYERRSCTFSDGGGEKNMRILFHTAPNESESDGKADKLRRLGYTVTITRRKVGKATYVYEVYGEARSFESGAKKNTTMKTRRGYHRTSDAV